MDKKVFIIFPIVVIVISFIIFFTLGENRRDHFEMPILLSIVLIMFIKVRKYNKKLKQEHRLEKGAQITTNLQKEQEEYRLLQRTLNFLILQMAIIYVISLIVMTIFSRK